MRVEVAYARPGAQLIIPLEVPAGTTAQEAIEASGIARQFPEIEARHAEIGVFGRVVARTRVLEEGDRVEIYRPLVADPKAKRRQRAVRSKPRR